MYVNAIRVYQKLIEKEDAAAISDEMRERIFHNQGCAYSYLFQMDKALDCFWMAWQVKKSEEALKTYLLAYRSVHTQEDFEKTEDELKVEESMKKEVSEILNCFISLPQKQIASGETGSFSGRYYKRISQKYRLMMMSLQEVRAGAAGLLFVC